ncbi:MAG: YbjN domain-containing protein, partial [Symploca sp. SIO2E6]|nr:YbjN domain-containing protein [Symploca sp. SIO2E6]
MNNFAKEWANTNGSGISEDVITQAIGEMTQTVEELTNSFSEMTQEVVAETMVEMNSAFEELADTFSEISQELDLEKSIFEIIVNFFNSEEWQFQIIQEQKSLRLVFQGNNGKWDCYANAREKQQQFVFYSVCPIKVPENQRLAIAEFITRVN